MLVFVQLLVFLIHAYYEKKFADVPRVLWQGAITGIVVGPFFDVIGTYLGLGAYAFGSGPLSLILNAVFMYSLFAANTLLMQDARLLRFCVWVFIYVAVVEIMGVFFPIWTYALAVPSVEYFVVAFGGPLVLAMGIAFAWHTLFRRRFVFISNIIGK